MFCLIAVVSRILLHFVLFVVPGFQYSIKSLNSPFDIASIALQTNGKKTKAWIHIKHRFGRKSRRPHYTCRLVEGSCVEASNLKQ